MNVETKLTEIPQTIEQARTKSEDFKNQNEERSDYQDEERSDYQADVQAVWEDLSPTVWRDSIYSEEAQTNCMGQLFTKEIEMFKELAQSVAKSGKYDSTAIIEVGMGTAELFSKVDGDFDMLVGIELSQGMIDLANALHPKFRDPETNVKLLNGNALELNDVIEEKAYQPDHKFWQENTFRLSCMCMNTFGILPDGIRKECLRQMFDCAGPKGMLIIGCWHQEALKIGFEDFYSKNPQLCGACTEDDFDFDKGNFVCKSSDYTSHWWTAQELKDVLEQSYPGKIEDLEIDFKIMGVGIFAICTIKSN